MALPAPYAEADDAALTEGCIAGDADAWRVLGERHGRLVEYMVQRVMDERGDGVILGEEAVVRRVFDELGREQAALLRQWSGASRLRTFVALVARRVASRACGELTPNATPLAAMGVPTFVGLEEVDAGETARRVAQTLARLPPNAAILVRLRLRGLDVPLIASTLGVTRAGVDGTLDRIAARLGEVHAAELDGAPAAVRIEAAASAWRLMLDAASPEERVALAVRTDDDREFRRMRAQVEAAFRRLRQDGLFRGVTQRGPLCLDDHTIAGFVDGSVRGSARARLEGHVGTCDRCVDEVATLAADLGAAELLRASTGVARDAALAGAHVYATRFRAGQRIAERAAAVAPKLGGELRRLAQVGAALEGGRFRERASPSVSGVLVAGVPSDDEAPLVALEALVADEPAAAERAIDEHLARGPIGARLRLLALAAGVDVDAARAMAEALRRRAHADPGLVDDVTVVLALPVGRALPPEILAERLRDLLPEVARWTLSRGR
jgi:hypothetical protein